MSSGRRDGLAWETAHERQQAVVVLPAEPVTYNGPYVKQDGITAVLAHREKKKEERYLVQWKTVTNHHTPYSWHRVDELKYCLGHVQKYLDSLALEIGSKKRKAPDDETEERSTREASTASSNARSGPKDLKCYRGKLFLDVERNEIVVEPRFDLSVPLPADQDIPWTFIKHRASQTSTKRAAYYIRLQFLRALDRFNSRHAVGARLQLENLHDGSTPSLDFAFIDKNILGNNVVAADPETILGCGDKKPWAPQICRPHMGQDIGCEYARVCECMEFAAVDETRMTEEDKKRLQLDQNRINLPKRFPYSAKDGLLVGFYLNSRHCIYECNSKCACGPHCKSRQVQKGRQVPLQIFRTDNGRGWGLRTLIDLKKGQFVDTYRGEIVTNEEADAREAAAEQESGKLKNSYLFSLDKHAGAELEPENCYVVDGEHMGGPTRFINHSCEPNCQMHTVSLNKFDVRVYELAFFANQAISKGTELTFDYMDKDGGDIDSEELPQQGEGQPCRCGSANCRKWLWL